MISGIKSALSWSKTRWKVALRWSKQTEACSRTYNMGLGVAGREWTGSVCSQPGTWGVRKQNEHRITRQGKHQTTWNKLQGWKPDQSGDEWLKNWDLYTLLIGKLMKSIQWFSPKAWEVECYTLTHTHTQTEKRGRENTGSMGKRKTGKYGEIHGLLARPQQYPPLNNGGEPGEGCCYQAVVPEKVVVKFGDP